MDGSDLCTAFALGTNLSSPMVALHRWIGQTVVIVISIATGCNWHQRSCNMVITYMARITKGGMSYKAEDR